MFIETGVHNVLHSSGVLCAQVGGNLGYINYTQKSENNQVSNSFQSGHLR